MIEAENNVMMQIVNSPVLHPRWFWPCVFVWSAFQFYTGFWYALSIYDSAYSDPSRCEICAKPTRKKHVKCFAYGFHHGAFYFLCSFSGFAAWYLLAYLIADRIINWPSITGGAGTVLIALAALAVSGISGALPRILYLGNRPV
jgi:hypothetical protein